MKSKIYLAAAIAASLAPASALAIDFKISGHVNQAVVFGGDVDDTAVVDNNISGSRFRFSGSGDMGNGMKAGMRYEFQLQDNKSSSNLIGANQSPDAADSLDGPDGGAGETRVSEVYVSGGFGKVSLGKGSAATDGAFEAYGLINYLAGAGNHLTFRGSVPGLAYRDYDGGRQNRIRYDSPKFAGGASVALSAGNNDVNEIAARYKGSVAGGTLDARIGLSDRDTEDHVYYSAAYKHGSGASFSYSGATDDNGAAADADSNWIMAGYTFGKTTVSYGTGTSGTSAAESDMDIIGVVYKPVKGVELYGNYMSYDDAGGVDGDGMALGGRVKF